MAFFSPALVHDSATHEVNARLLADITADAPLTAAHFASLAASIDAELARTREDQARSEALQLGDLAEASELIRKVGRARPIACSLACCSQAADDIAHVDASLALVSKLCAAEPTVDLGELRRVASARANIAVVLEQLDLYSMVHCPHRRIGSKKVTHARFRWRRQVPAHVKTLSASLAADPRGANLRRVRRRWTANQARAR